MRENILWKTRAMWRRKRKIIFPNQNKDTPRREIFRTLCNSYLKSAEQVVERLLNYPIPEQVAATMIWEEELHTPCVLGLIVAGVLIRFSFLRLGFAVLRVWLPNQLLLAWQLAELLPCG